MSRQVIPGSPEELVLRLIEGSPGMMDDEEIDRCARHIVFDEAVATLLRAGKIRMRWPAGESEPRFWSNDASAIAEEISRRMGS